MPRQLDLRLALPATAAWLGAWVGLDAPVPAVVACCGVVSVVGVLAWRRRRFAAAAAGLCLLAGLAVAALRVVALHLGPLDELAAQRAVASADL
jgi:competence protein ComEC